MLCGEVLQETLDGSGIFLDFDGHCVNCSGRQCGSELWNPGQQSAIATRSSADVVGNTAEECEACTAPFNLVRNMNHQIKQFSGY
jgi:hypothetical protein